MLIRIKDYYTELPPPQKKLATAQATLVDRDKRPCGLSPSWH